MSVTERTVKVDGNSISFRIEPFMVADKQKGYWVHGSSNWNPFRISTKTKADGIIAALAKMRMPKVSVLTETSKRETKRAPLSPGERDRIRERATKDGVEIGTRGSIPEDIYAKYSDNAWMSK